jgi:monoamine oxidase
VNPGAGDQPGVPTQPLDLESLVKAGYARGLGLGRNYNQQPTMLTPSGGMDRIASGFANKLGDVIRYHTEVREVRRSGGGVTIRYAAVAPDGTSNPSAEIQEITGDFCVCTLPPALLTRLPADFSKPTATALATPRPSTAGKIGLQFKRRFWEEDDGIYGGLSLTDQPIAQIGYPYDNYGSRGKGVLMGYYHFGTSKAQLDVHPFLERERRALEQGAKVHPQYPSEFENSFSVAWYRIPRSEMSWVDWHSESDFASVQKALGESDGPFYFAGDWLSHVNAWQAGAFASAHRVCRQLHARALAT